MSWLHEEALANTSSLPMMKGDGKALLGGTENGSDWAHVLQGTAVWAMVQRRGQGGWGVSSFL